MIKEIIVDAYVYAREKHKGQKRKFSNLDYFTHPKAVARIIEDLTKNHHIVAAALLNDVIEDTDSTYEELVDKFGIGIADLVMEVTETLEKRNGRKKVDYLIDEIKHMSEDALTLKLADRYHNVKWLAVDITNVAHYGFVIYYTKQTKEIMNTIQYSKLNDVQTILYDGIMNSIMYIEKKFWRK